MRYILIGLLSTFFLLAWAQDHQLVDSLRASLKTATSERERVDLYCELAHLFAEVDSVMLVSYVDSATLLANRIGYLEGGQEARHQYGWSLLTKGKVEDAKVLFDSLLDAALETKNSYGEVKNMQMLAIIAQQQSEYKIAIEYDSIALTKAKELDNLELLAIGYNNIGSTYESLGDYEKALTAYTETKKISEQMGDKRTLARVLNNISGIHLNQGDFQTGLTILFESIAIEEELGNDLGVGQSFLNVALIYYFQQDFETSLKYLYKALEIFKRLDYPYGLSYNYRALGTIYEEQGDVEKALVNLVKAVELDEKLGNTAELSRDYSTIGLLYAASEEYENAITYTMKAVELSEKISNPEDAAIAKINLARIYYDQGKYYSAKKYVSEGVKTGKSLGFPAPVRDGLELLAQVEEKLGNIANAYRTHVEFKKLSDSLRNDERVRELAKIESEYEFQKEKDSIQFANEKQLLAKNNEILLLEEKDKVSRLRLFLIAFSAIIIIVFGSFVARSRVRAKSAQAKQLKEIGDFKQAMTGMVAHDLKNPLSVIMNGDTMELSKEMASRMLVLVNNMLDVQKFESAEIKLSLEVIDASVLVEDVLTEIRPLLKWKNLALECEIQDSRFEGDYQMMRRVLVNLLTNAIKYSPKNGKVTVKASSSGEHLRLSIADQGKGIPKDQLEAIFSSFVQFDPKASGGVGSTGLGLTFVKLALQAHDTEVKVESKIGEGSTFYFDLQPSRKSAQSTIKKVGVDLHLTQEEKEIIADKVELLRQLNIHQIGEIQEELKVIKVEKEGLKRWVDAVLNAAYDGNKERYAELLDEVKTS